MKTIHRESIAVSDGWISVLMDRAAPVVKVAPVGNDRVEFWFITEPTQPKVTRYFALTGTGQLIQSDGVAYLGTADRTEGGLVWHLWEFVGTRPADDDQSFTEPSL